MEKIRGKSGQYDLSLNVHIISRYFKILRKLYF